MSKAQWKQPYLKQAEKRVADREQAIAEAKFWKERADALQTQVLMVTVERDGAKAMVRDLKGRAGGYDYLRSLGVVVMGDEPKHLQGEDMDKYIERHTWNSLSSASGKAFFGKSITSMVLDEATEDLQKHINEHIKFKATGRYNFGNDTGSKSKEADQKDSGHYTDILRYADWHRVWKQRCS